MNVRLARTSTDFVRTWASRFLPFVKWNQRGKGSGPNLLPVLIQVMASFSKLDGEVLEEEIDSILGFLRYDYPEAVYFELRDLFQEALRGQQDLSEMAHHLALNLSWDRKIMLGVQLYDLISRAGLKQEQVVAYYSFMSQLGMAAQAIDIVYQLNASEEADPVIFQKGASPLESLCIGSAAGNDVVLKGLGKRGRLMAFRYHDLILLRNLTEGPVTVRGRPLARGSFCRIYPGDRVVTEDQILTHNDLTFYFNAKKNVAFHQIYLKVLETHEVEIERSRSRESAIEVIFGLSVKVRALRDVPAEMNGIELKAGTVVDASLEDRIVFAGSSELELLELRRRARAMGGRFHLKSHKSKYLVSNNPSLLKEDDILLSPGVSGEVLLSIACDYEQRTGVLEVLQADRPILVREEPVRNKAALFDGDVIEIDSTQVLKCDFSDRVIEEERNVIRQLEVRNLSHQFEPQEVALDGVSFSIARGEMLCIMGGSGSGKSTLLRTIAGQLKPNGGEILLNGVSLYANLSKLKEFVAHIPQYDAFDEFLTIEENLDFAAAVRSPHLSKRERVRRIDNRLAELGLHERRETVVGSHMKKNLSGGERKRLNIGLDMIGTADVYLFDEPTSGLSSKDSEHVIEILRNMAHNKIVVAVVHQPSSKIFHKFNKALLLDKGGRMVFFGTPREMLAYFADVEHRQHFEPEEEPETGLMRPEFIFDVLETPLRDLSGDIIFEPNARGQLVPARRYPPTYWRDKFESYLLLKEVKEVPVRREIHPDPLPKVQKMRGVLRWRSEWTQFQTLFGRAFRSKMRNKTNLYTTIVAAPALALLVATVLRYSPTGEYDFASAAHVPRYLFISLLVAMFLGLTNSADDIIRDRAVLQRERNLGIRVGYYVSAKFLTLAIFGAAQCLLYIFVGNTVIEARGMVEISFLYLFLTSLCGISIGLLISSRVADAKTAANLVPIVLIPQIMLAGALISYEEMNKNLDLKHSLSRLLAGRSAEDLKEVRSDLEVPFVCEFMPLRWSYEALVLAQAKLNPLTRRQEVLQKRIRSTAAIERPTAEDSQRLEDYKNLLAALSGIEGESPREVEHLLRQVDIMTREGFFNRDALQGTGRRFSGEQLYVNQQIVDLVAKAEFEEADYRREGGSVFFGRNKNYFGLKGDTLVFNAVILGLATLFFLILLRQTLQAQLRMEGE